MLYNFALSENVFPVIPAQVWIHEGNMPQKK